MIGTPAGACEFGSMYGRCWVPRGKAKLAALSAMEGRK
jgi:hypothetical protein